MIYLYLFGTCFHFIYVFMIIGNNMESWQEVTDLRTSIIRHFQEEVGASYDFREIIDNLDDEEILDSIISWAKKNGVRIFNDKICRTT